MTASKLLRAAISVLIVAVLATVVSAVHNSTDGLGTVAWLLSSLGIVIGVLLLVAAGVAKLAASRQGAR